MKPKRTQKSIKSRLQEPKLSDKGEKLVSKTQGKTSCKSNPGRNKPFSGKLFYLDLPSNRAEALENDIKQLGGTVEKFFSKDIRYLVSNRREAKYVQRLCRDSPAPSPESIPSSPHLQRCPGSHGDCLKGSSQGQADTVVTSRGKLLVERVVKEQERIQVNQILSNALEWGVKVLYIDDILAYIEKKNKVRCNADKLSTTTTAVKKSTKAQGTRKPASQKYKGGRISKPFVKVEDSSRHYRPIYLAMSYMPEFNLRSAPPCSPFFQEGKDQPGTRDHRNQGAKASANEERGQTRTRRNREKKRGGYCECCTQKYDNVKYHLQSEQHKAFSRSDEYEVVDRLVSTLPFNFINITTPHTRRPKCSVSSMLRPAGTTLQMEEEQVVGLVSCSATLEAPPSQCVGTPVVKPSGEHLNPSRGGPPSHRVSSIPLCKPQPKHRHLSPKPPCLQGLQVVLMPMCRDGTNTSSHDSGTKLRCCNRSAHLDRHGSSTLPHGLHLERGCPDGRLNVSHSQHYAAGSSEQPKCFEDCDRGDSVLSRDTLPGKLGDLPENEAGAESSPSERTLRRRVRDYRRKKRRKVETRLPAEPSGHGEPDSLPIDSLPNLWQLFQSSEDDME
ncbi:hypothetical protein UPYG_G00156370 [Umbra pygmaea]|uniref:Protein DBF4 homolog A n=1 Tax=Umbra pygmaea TaxID=75934 RepID=A0ABD0WYA4_UMBPY